MKNLILGMDPGNFEAKVCGPYGAISFKSNIAPMMDLKVSETHGDDDMVYKINGKPGLAGTLAMRESRFGSSSMLGKSKAHEDTKIRVLLAIFRYIDKFKLNVDTVSLVTGQPVDGHDDIQKDAIKKMLKGTHQVIVNNKEMEIVIKEVGVAPEGTGAFWGSNQEHPNCNIFDFGSGTVNAVSIKEFRHINSASATFNYGTESKGMTLEQVAFGAIRESSTLGWEKDAVTLICGGSAGKIITPILEHYEYSQILIPTLVLEKGTPQMLEPKFANCVGFYNIARGTFQ